MSRRTKIITIFILAIVLNGGALVFFFLSGHKGWSSLSSDQRLTLITFTCVGYFTTLGMCLAIWNWRKRRLKGAH